MNLVVTVLKVSAAAGIINRRFESVMSVTEQSENSAIVPTVTKLRESCDSCLVAKVRCSKTRPVCTRCLATGAICGYSPSSRAGRKNRNTPGSDLSKTSMRFEKASALSEDPPPSPSSFRQYSNNGVFHDSKSNLSHEDPSRGQSRIESKTPTIVGGIEMTDSFPNPPFDEFGNAFLQFYPKAYLQDLNPTTPSPLTSSSQDFLNPVWTAKDPLYPPSLSFQSPIDLFSFGQASSSDSATSAEVLAHQESDHRSPFPPGGEIRLTCDCFALCLQALETLHNHSRLPASAQPGGLPFDVVLTINREAMRDCAAMLDCAKCVSKSGDSVSTMLLATIFGKIISLYGAACFFRFGPSTGAGAGHHHAGVQLAYGAYTPTSADRRLLEMEIILLELRKVESILLAYQERFRDAKAEKDETSVYNALTNYLDKNLRYILDFLQARRATCK
ncbi:hypothetical protein MMC07_006299 [Pseudocyphellaria aurata]|nr:hypothetical protein [Pseudocyphellaria aurata]